MGMSPQVSIEAIRARYAENKNIVTDWQKMRKEAFVAEGIKNK